MRVLPIIVLVVASVLFIIVVVVSVVIVVAERYYCVFNIIVGEGDPGTPQNTECFNQFFIC